MPKLSKELSVYKKVFGTLAGFTTELPGIEQEMRAIASAQTEEEACKVIRWWGCWEYKSKDPEKALLKSVRKVRELMAKE